ncbi:MAG: DUF4442 domain-containing protein [Bdellovibrionales bacterium]
MSLKELKLTALINAYSALQIPLLGFITPRVMELGPKRSMVRVRLDRRTRNHLGVMYFGALAMGAELSIALKAVECIASQRLKVDFIFKDFQAEFLRRADGHVHFVCDQVEAVEKLIMDATQSEERLEKKFSGFAFVPSSSEEPVMKYKLTLSVKKRGSSKGRK